MPAVVARTSTSGGVPTITAIAKASKRAETTPAIADRSRSTGTASTAAPNEDIDARMANGIRIAKVSGAASKPAIATRSTSSHAIPDATGTGATAMNAIGTDATGDSGTAIVVRNRP